MFSRDDLKKHGFTIGTIAIGFIALGYFYFKVKKKHPRSASVATSPALTGDFKRKHFQKGTLLLSMFTDLEKEKDRSLSPEKSVSGLYSSRLSMTNEYGYAVTKKIGEIPDYKTLTTVQIRFKCWMRSEVSNAQYLLTISDKEGKVLCTLAKMITCPKSYEWNDLQYSYGIDPKFLDAENTIRIYAWNKDFREFFIDDISVTFLAENKENAASANPEFSSNFLYDFEKPEAILERQADRIKEGNAHSGKRMFDLSNAQEYGPIVTRQVGDVCLQPLKRVHISIWVYPVDENASVDLGVALFNAANEKYFLQTKRIETKRLLKNKWTKINATIVCPTEGAPLDDVVQVLARNRSKTKMLLDDFEIVYDDMKEAPGEASLLSAETLYKHEFKAERNKPPFRILSLNKAEIGNANSPLLINSGADKTGDLTPGDDYLSGNFIGGSTETDQLIDIKANAVAMYSFCSDKKKFTETWKYVIKNENDFFGPATEKLVGDFDRSGADDVVLIDRKKKTVVMASFAGKDACVNTPGTPLWTSDPEKINPFENWTMSDDDVFIAADLNGDHQTELLIVNAKSGNWGLFQRKDKSEWNAIAVSNTENRLDAGYFNKSNSQHLSGRFLAGKSNDVLYAAKTLKGVTTYLSLEYNAARKQFEQKTLPSDSDEPFFMHGNTTLAGDFDEDDAQEIVNLNTAWRFDLKLVDVDATGFNIAGMLDFNGYPADHNPKYYEFVKIVAGNFTNAKKTSLLVIMRNCADKNFSGDACKQYENLDYLPNSTQLYQFEP